MKTIRTALNAIAASLLLAGAAHAAPASYTLTTINGADEDHTVMITDWSGVSFNQSAFIMPNVWQLDSGSASYLAFCIDPWTGGNPAADTTYASSVTAGISDLGKLNGVARSTLIGNLYNTAYASIGSGSSFSLTTAASFQLALWELSHDNGDVYSGTSQYFSQGLDAESGGLVVDAAAQMLSSAASYSGANHYHFQEFLGSSSAGASQTVLAATVAAVPEPETYAMLAAGLGLIGFLGRRKAAKQQA